MSLHVQVTKLTRLPNRPNGDLLAIDHIGSIEEGYTLRGYMTPPKLGEPFRVDRYERNGVKAIGQFTTSPVQKIGDIYDDGTFCIETENSVYQLEDLG